ncbi:hypothetical protein F4821DRAFT_122885 [Hypoxylon rubiginosum]|uniref:Uncharacterized protein n=1 Tax=Hypoxylon rubiginosum TaxID=110542 RepID=A0ACC0D2G2_9PEZI|nr:hypothetical protein F4821DRAFT_122885 [Hypoxylon rubiginosum]
MKVSITVGAFLVALLGQGIAQDTGINACASGCVNGVFVNAPSMNCALDDRVCVCNNTTDFTDGIRDCVNQACGSDAAAQLPLAQAYGADQCKSASSAAGLLPAATPAPSSASVASPAVPTEQAPANTATTTAAETTATPVPTSSAVAVSSAAVTAAAAGTTTTAASSAALPTPESSVATSSPASSPVSSPISSAAAASSSSSSLSSDSASTTVGDADTPSGTSSAEESGDASPTPDTSQDTMTTAVRAGIGAGVGAAVVLLALLAVFLCMRRRKQKKAAATQGPTLQISEPLPGSGRQYADPMRQTEAGLSKTFVAASTNTRDLRQTSSQQTQPPTPTTPSAASYSSELDANTRRYEDMQRGTQPRTMI